MDRVSICESLLNRNEIEPCLKQIITRNEKWITYDNNVRKDRGRSFTNDCKARIDSKESDAECLAELERNCSAWVARTWPNH